METLDHRQFWRTVHRFNSSYYSGLDVRVYLNDRWLDVLSALEFQVQELVIPVYGYKSYEFDTVLQGIRTIQGNLAIHFVRPMYLLELIQESLSGSYDEEPPASDTDLLAGAGGRDAEYYRQIYERRHSLISRYWDKQDAPRPSYPTATTWSAPVFPASTPVNMAIVYADPVGRESESPQFGVDTSYSSDILPSRPGALVLGRHLEVVSDLVFTGVSRAIDDSGHSLMEVYSFVARTWNDSEDLDLYARLIEDGLL